jgi:Mg2+ and Co2+ transporter CorA
MTYAEAIRRCKLDRAWVALSLLDAYTESMLDAIEDYGDQPLAAIVARGFRLTVAA